MNHFFQYRKQVFHAANLLIVNQNKSVLEVGFHFFGIGHKIWTQITAIELHTFYYINCSFSAFGFFNSNYTVFAHFLHRLSNQLADGAVVVGRNRSHLLNFAIVVAYRLGHFIQFTHCSNHRFVDTALQIHRIRTGCNVLQTTCYDGLRQYCCGSSSITSYISGFACYFLQHLGTHVFNWVYQFNFFRYSYTIFCDVRSAKFFVDYNIATFGSQGYFNSICQGINASFQAIAGRQIKVYFLCHDFSFLSIR